MRIAYVCHYDAFVYDGVVQKISTQVAEWRRRGNEVELFCLSSDLSSMQAPTLEGSVFTYGGHLKRVSATLRLESSVRRYGPHVIYLRYDLFFPPLIRTLRSAPSALEINGRGAAEIRLREGRSPTWFYNELSARISVPLAAGLVFVSRELARSRELPGRAVPKIVIGNGADADRMQPFPAPANVRPRIVFLGRVAQWHGIDKVLWLAMQMPEADFDLVGVTPADLSSSVPDNVTVHGMLMPSDYEPILAASDVAIGTLALHRLGMSEASPLKVREYLLRGLPVVIGYEETDFLDENPWFILRLPNTPSNLSDNLAEIRAFVQRSRGKRVPREAVVERVGTRAKESARLAFMQRLVAEWAQ